MKKRKTKPSNSNKKMVRIDHRTVVFIDKDKDEKEYVENYLKKRLEIKSKYGHN